jgi:preprotein translocase subunit SecE
MTEHAMMDKFKLTFALALAVAGLWGYYQLADAAIVIRVLVVAGGVVGGFVVSTFTAPGQRAVAFTREALVEVRKVVWPTRKETMQTTAMVFAFVVAMALFLWLTDKSLEWVLYDLVLGWKKT